MATKTTISWEGFLASGSEDQRWEWVDGEITQMTAASFWHEIVLARLMTHVTAFCESHPDWLWVPSNAVFTMDSGNWRLPDLSMFKKERLPNGVIPTTRAEFAPDIAFEILSPGNSPSYIQQKRKDYGESGVIQVWIDPEKRFIELIYPDRALEYVREGESSRSAVFRSSAWRSKISSPSDRPTRAQKRLTRKGLDLPALRGF